MPCYVNIYITSLGLTVKLADICRHVDIESLKDKLTISHSQKIGYRSIEKKAYFYRIVNRQYIAAPRFAGLKRIMQAMCPQLIFKFIPGISAPEPFLAELFVPGPTLKEYQRIVYDHMIAQIYSREKQTGSCILVMATGLGKTYMAAALMHYLRRKTLVIIPNKTGLDDWIKALTSCFPAAKIGEYHAETKSDGDIMIITAASAAGKKFALDKTLDREDFYTQFGFIVFDEVHDFASPKRQEIFWYCGAPYRLGITATPDERLDGMDFVYKKHLGPTIIAAELSGFDVGEYKWKGVVEMVKYKGPPEYTQDIRRADGWCDTQSVCKQLAEDPYRNMLILRAAQEFNRRGDPVFIFAEHRDYVEFLYRKLCEAGVPPAMEGKCGVFRYMGGARKGDREIAEKYGNIILTTYGFSRQSLSIPKMCAIIFGTPRRNKMRQILGRILRVGGDPGKVRRIIDIVDICTPLGKQSSTRKSVYKEKGFQIEIKYKDYLTIKNDPNYNNNTTADEQNKKDTAAK